MYIRISSTKQMKNTTHTNLTMFSLLLQNVMVAAKLLKTDLLYHLLAQDQYFHMTYIISTSLSQTCIFAAYKKCSTVCNYNLNF